MKTVTRFNPTINGYLHLGHAYLLRVLRDSAEVLICRDDRQRYWSWVNRAELVEFERVMRADVEWLGIEVDQWSSNLDYGGQVHDLLENVFHYQPEKEPFVHDQAPEVVGLEMAFYGYTDFLTCEKVVIDFLEGVNWLIRGWDLLPEYSLYSYYVNLFMLPRVRQTFVPRLFWAGDVVSKTEGKFKLKDLREKGMESGELWQLLGHDCLKDESAAWTIDNIKVPWPVLGDWANEFLA
jgi:glutamyl/glutaminyl-tRNA synthetase